MDKKKNFISKIALFVVIVGSVGAITCGVSPSEVSDSVQIGNSIVILVTSIISYIFKENK